MKSLRSLTPVLLVVAATAATVGCKKTEAATTPAPAESAVAVPTFTVEEKPMPRVLALSGTLKGQRETDLAANAVGRVLATNVERGQEVKAGDILARLDVRSATLAAAEAKTNAELAKTQEETAKRECDRYKQLVDKGAISQAEYDKFADQCRSTSLSVQAAQARAALAAQTLSDGTVRAPFGGVIAERFVEPGEYVRQDSKVVTLVSLDPLRLVFSVPEVHVPAVQFGSRVRFTVPAYPDKQFEGVVQFVGAAVRETTRDLPVEAVVSNKDRVLRPGMFAAIDLELGQAPQPVLPQSALRMKDGRAHAFVVVDKRVEERVLQLGAHKGDEVAVVRGVKAGDKVVAKPADDLRNGQRVQ